MLGQRIRKQINDLYEVFMDPRGTYMRANCNALLNGGCKEVAGDTPEEAVIVFITRAFEAHAACWTAMTHNDQMFMSSELGQFLWQYWFHSYSHVLEVLAENPELERQVWPDGLPELPNQLLNIEDDDAT